MQKKALTTLARLTSQFLNAILLILVCKSAYSASSSLMPPDDPRQSVTYWKAHTLEQSNPLVEKARSVFNLLLRGWDQSRLPPELYVVESSAGAWAASLADGNILLSKTAIEQCNHFGTQRSDHLLAFVLAHELAHQHADDLWHQRFFRMIGSQSPALQEKLLKGAGLDSGTLALIEEKEAQADHDGLLLMASVGFDPYQVIDKKDFFTLWVESIWKQSCEALKDKSKRDTSLQEACDQAQNRALRTRAQLDTVAVQATLYQLGVQAFIAKQYDKAREYFTAYGRDYPSRAVMSSIGLSWLAQAQDLQQLRISLGESTLPDFYYPLMLDATATAEPVSDKTGMQHKRASAHIQAQKRKQKLDTYLKQSSVFFEKAIRLAPQHRKSYLLLATTHLLANNTYLARGVLQGRYIPAFGEDDAVSLLLAITFAEEGHKQEAEEQLGRLYEKITLRDKAETQQAAISLNNLLYAITYNRSVLLQEMETDHQSTQKNTKRLWKKLASQAQKSGNTLLFRLAINHINPTATTLPLPRVTQAPAIEGLRSGDSVSRISETATAGKTEFWIDGEPFRLTRTRGGGYFVSNKEGRLISLWQAVPSTDTNSLNDTYLIEKIKLNDHSDRPFKSLGIPDRQVDLVSGEFLAYDNYGVAIQIKNNRVKGWFLYQTDP